MRPDDPDAVSVTPRRSAVSDHQVGMAVAVIAALLLAGGVGAVLFPVFSSTRQTACRPLCQSNLMQLGTALQMYATDYDDHLPKAAIWGDSLSPYVKNTTVYVCPPRSRAPGYAFNSRLDRRLLGKIDAPANAPALFDSSTRLGDAADPLLSFITPHAGTGMVAYADGHVRGERSAPSADAGLRKPAPRPANPSGER